MNKKQVSMQYIADKVGVSKVTVSKALNSLPGVSSELRKKITDMSLELGYQKKSSSKKAQNILILMSKRFFIEDENFYKVILYYLNDICAKSGYSSNFYILDEKADIEMSIINSLTSGSITGICILGEIHKEYITKLLKYNILIVGIDFYMPDVNVSFVINDNYLAAYFATIHLINLGHNRIGFSGDVKHSQNVFDRFMGYKKALMQNNIVFDESLIIHESNIDNIFFPNFTLPENMPSAFFCHCDKAAYMLIKRLQDMGYKIPEDISVIGFDNTELSQKSVPAITTINIDKKAMATKAFDLLTSLFEDQAHLGEIITLNCKLIKRDSTNEK